MTFPVIDRAYVTERLTNQAPRTEVVGRALDSVTLAAIEFGAALAQHVPPGPDLTLAIRLLEDSVFRAKKGIALNQPEVDVGL